MVLSTSVISRVEFSVVTLPPAEARAAFKLVSVVLVVQLLKVELAIKVLINPYFIVVPLPWDGVALLTPNPLTLAVNSTGLTTLIMAWPAAITREFKTSIAINLWLILL